MSQCTDAKLKFENAKSVSFSSNFDALKLLYGIWGLLWIASKQWQVSIDVPAKVLTKVDARNFVMQFFVTVFIVQTNQSLASLWELPLCSSREVLY